MEGNAFDVVGAGLLQRETHLTWCVAGLLWRGNAFDVHRIGVEGNAFDVVGAGLLRGETHLT